jgi:hypothetical protein
MSTNEPRTLGEMSPEFFDAVCAPLDPAAVKAGDMVTTYAELAALPEGSAVVDRMNDTGVIEGGSIHYPETSPQTLERAAKKYGPFTVVYQPAPEPEPVWEPGTSGTATLLVGADANSRRIVVRLTGNEFALEYPLAWADLDGNRYIESEVSDFVPDEPRPLPTLDEMAEALEFAGDDTMHRREHAQAMLQFLRGESR